MANTGPTSVSRYRPAILVIAGAAAAYATYLVYTISQVSPSDGLHRSNAVRRPHARQRRRTSQGERLSALAAELPAMSEFNYNGVRIPFGFRDLISRTQLHEVVVQQHPEYTAEQVEAEIDRLYDNFLAGLFMQIFPRRAPSGDEVEIMARWVADRHSDQILQPTTAVERVAARHIFMLENTVRPAVDGTQSVAATELSWGSDDDTEGEAIDSDGQTLQRTLYHIAEDRARQEGVVHRGITCNSCDEKPIRGIRWHCANCADFDLCSNCEATNSHTRTHIFYKIRVPAPYLGIAKQEPLYPGKPHVMTSSIPSVLKKRLVAETELEAEEIDALWEQFTCLAGTEWMTDPNNVGWAIDRRAFNHAFVPRYKSFVAAPNLIYDRIFSYYDSDKNSLIGFEEWIKGIDGMHATDPQVKSKIIFNGYDIDGDGYISRKDILRIFRAYYAIEQEATRDYIAEITEDLSVRNALDIICTGQALGSAFMPHGGAPNDSANPRLREKDQDDLANTEPVLQEDHPDTVEREAVLVAADTHTIARQGVTQSDHSRVVTDRWARRQFYIDEEEGLVRPEGAEDDMASREEDVIDPIIQTDDSESTSNRPNARSRWSRSSSRVRFQDDLDMETRSNASTSSRPVGERWGGYEIPEPEKDLGKEVLYQITQQGFNELLDPIFEEKENNAMDAYATRSERRKCVTQLENVAGRFKRQELGHLRAIYRIGIFRYSKCIVDIFCNAISQAPAFENTKAIFHESNGNGVDRETARSRLLGIYLPIEHSFLDTIGVPDEWGIDDMALWNTWLCRIRFLDEVLAATLDCASQLGWIPYAKPGETPVHTSALVSAPHRDPTMPQFRPNSSTDIVATDSPFNDFEDVRATYGSSFLSLEALGSILAEDRMTSSTSGPFFVGVKPSIDQSDPEPVVQATHQVSTTTASWNVPLFGASASGSVQERPDEQQNIKHFSNYTDNPMMHILNIESSNGSDQLQSSAKPVIHTSNPFHPESDQTKPLYRRIRELAMNPDANSHDILLASLEAVQHQIYERKGSGLVSFEEFDEHMKQGRLRFLESWMEWVSI
jgi:Ca2+-binding EF-hand superfamily protein